MHQKNGERRVNAATSTVTNREKNRTNPRLRFPPGVFKFLGDDPLQTNATSLGEKIKQQRIQKGLSLRKLAKVLGIGPGTLARREKGKIRHIRHFSTLEKRLRVLIGQVRWW